MRISIVNHLDPTIYEGTAVSRPDAEAEASFSDILNSEIAAAEANSETEAGAETAVENGTEAEAEDSTDDALSSLGAVEQNALAIDAAIAQAKALGQSGLSVYSSEARALGIVPINSYSSDSASRSTSTWSGSAEDTVASYSAELAALCDKYSGYTRDLVAYSGDTAGSYEGNLSCSEELNSYFDEAAQTYNVDVKLLKSVAKAESGFRSDAVSSAGAIGVMQLMPATAAGLGVTDATDARQNIMGGAKYLSQLLDKYDGDVTLALASYNAGGSKVDQYGGIPPYDETRTYVVRVLGYYES